MRPPSSIYSVFPLPTSNLFFACINCKYNMFNLNQYMYSQCLALLGLTSLHLNLNLNIFCFLVIPHHLHEVTKIVKLDEAPSPLGKYLCDTVTASFFRFQMDRQTYDIFLLKVLYCYDIFLILTLLLLLTFQLKQGIYDTEVLSLVLCSPDGNTATAAEYAHLFSIYLWRGRGQIPELHPFCVPVALL